MSADYYGLTMKVLGFNKVRQACILGHEWAMSEIESWYDTTKYDNPKPPKREWNTLCARDVYVPDEITEPNERIAFADMVNESARLTWEGFRRE